MTDAKTRNLGRELINDRFGTMARTADIGSERTFVYGLEAHFSSDVRRSSFLIFTKINWFPSHGCIDDCCRGARNPCPITRKQIVSSGRNLMA